MSKISKELIESYRKVVLPFVSKQLLKADFEGQGETDKTEFEHDFNEILDLALSALNPSGDCISREDLKKALDKKALDLANGGMIFIESINRIIDNAQAVEFSLLPLSGEADDAYMRGYEVGKAEGILKANTRPQGEWSEFEGGYRCSNCDDIEVYTPNFCPNCGADMQKGGAE